MCHRFARDQLSHLIAIRIAIARAATPKTATQCHLLFISLVSARVAADQRDEKRGPASFRTLECF
jgi:hypothetical protein